MTFYSSTFAIYIQALCFGIAAGFTIGFMAWGLGFAVYGIIKMIKSR